MSIPKCEICDSCGVDEGGAITHALGLLCLTCVAYAMGDDASDAGLDDVASVFLAFADSKPPLVEAGILDLVSVPEAAS